MQTISFAVSTEAADTLATLMNKHSVAPLTTVSSEEYDSLDPISRYELSLCPLFVVKTKGKISEICCSFRTCTPRLDLVQRAVVWYMAWFALHCSRRVSINADLFGRHLRIGDVLHRVRMLEAGEPVDTHALDLCFMRDGGSEIPHVYHGSTPGMDAQFRYVQHHIGVDWDLCVAACNRRPVDG